MGLTETRIRSKNFLAHAQFPELTELGITDSEIQDELTGGGAGQQIYGADYDAGLVKRYVDRQGRCAAFGKIPQYPNIRKLDIHHNYLSVNMAKN